MFMILGAYLEIKLGAGDEWKESMTRGMWKTAHLHGAIFGILNIVYGLLIRNLKLDGKLIKTGSIFAVIAALLFPVGLFLGGINFKFVYIAPIGGLCMIIAWAIMFYKLLKERF
jgi:uncharacterized membrane protein YgdD (TMEM256/DUF423 family)